MELFRLFGTIAINSTGAKEAIDDVDNKAKGLSDKLQTVGGKVTSFGNKLSKKITAPAVAAGGAIMAFASKSASAGDKIDKMSQKIGISRQAYQELDFICSQSGTSVDTLQMGMKTLTAAMTGAANGTKSNVAQFEKLGVSVTDANGKLRKQEDVMFDAMAAMQKMDNQTEKARLATELFGRSGSELMPLLNGASGSIEEMKQKAHDLGLVISDEAVDSSVVFSDTMDQLKRSLSAAALKAGTALLPIITEIAQAFIEKGVPAIQKFSEKVQAAIKWFDGLNSGTKKVIATIAALVVGIGPALSITGKMISTVGKIINVGKLLITVVGGISAPMLAVVAAIAAVVAIGVTLYKNWDTIKKKAAELKENMIATFSSIPSKMKEIGANIVKGLWNGIGNAKDWILSKIKGFGSSILNGLKSFFGIHSPSTVMEKQVGKNLVLGIGNGISKNSKYAKNIAKKFGEDLLSTLDKRLSNYKVYNDMSLKQEVDYWKNARKLFKKGTQDRIDADAKYYEAKKNLNQQLKQLEQDYLNTLKEADQKIADRTSSILQSFSLFSDFEMGDMPSGDSLMKSLESQVTALYEWEYQMKALKDKIGNSGLYQAIEDLGVQSLAQVKAINSMTETELKRYNTLYNARTNQAAKQAKSELGKQVAAEKKAAKKTYTAATKKATKKLKAHADGGILTKPTVFGYTPATNTYHLGGEAGAEAVAPIETLMGYVRTAVAEQNESIMSEIKSLLEKLLQTVQQGQGDTIIPVYIGNDKIDEIIMTAKQRITNRSGGFANV